MFEPVHGSAPDIAGLHLAHPLACFWTAKMMLDHLGVHGDANLLLEAIEKHIKEGNVLTRDLGGTASTQEVTIPIIHQILKK